MFRQVYNITNNYIEAHADTRISFSDLFFFRGIEFAVINFSERVLYASAVYTYLHIALLNYVKLNILVPRSLCITCTLI